MIDPTRLREMTIRASLLPNGYRQGGDALVTTYTTDTHERVVLLPPHDASDYDSSYGWDLSRVIGLDHEDARYFRGWYISSAADLGFGHRQDLRTIKAARRFHVRINVTGALPNRESNETFVAYELNDDDLYSNAASYYLIETEHGWDITTNGSLGSTRHNRYAEQLALAGATGKAWWVPRDYTKPMVADHRFSRPSRPGLHLPRPLKFVRSEDRYSVYLEDGVEVYLGEGGRRMVEADHINLADLWDEVNHTLYIEDQKQQFIALFEERCIDDVVDEIGFCIDCSRPDWNDNQTWVDSVEGWVGTCHSGNYSVCAGCDEVYRYTYFIDDERWCESCRDESFYCCGHCSEWVRNDSDHYHEDGTRCCESPQMSFTIPNDGLDPVANDERVTITTPAGSISDAGREEIISYLYNCSYTYLDEDATGRPWRSLARLMRGDYIEWEWQTDRGNFTKRLSSLAHKQLTLKIPTEVLSHVGTLANDHSRGTEVQIEFTRNLNLSAEEFYHEDSCWWQSYYPSRCALKTNGGIGMRSFDSYGDVNGRAWVLPLKRSGEQHKGMTLSPTFETHADAYIVFNGYGALDGYHPARILAQMTGLTYRKIGFEGPPMYVNSGGYLVAEETIVKKYADAGLLLPLEQHADLFTTEQAATTTTEEHSHAIAV